MLWPFSYALCLYLKIHDTSAAKTIDGWIPEIKIKTKIRILKEIISCKYFCHTFGLCFLLHFLQGILLEIVSLFQRLRAVSWVNSVLRQFLPNDSWPKSFIYKRDFHPQNLGGVNLFLFPAFSRRLQTTISLWKQIEMLRENSFCMFPRKREP